jgi:ribosome-binding ATPase
MQIGLLGLPQSGKKTLLRLLTKVDASAAAGTGPVPGVCEVRDPRVDELSGLYKPKKVTRATIQYLLLPDLTKDSAKNQELFRAILQVDVLAVVIRAFADDTVFHVDGSVNPGRDLDLILSELLLNDMIFIEKRLERIAKEARGRAAQDRSQEIALLNRLQEPLNQSIPLRTLTLTPDEEKLLSGGPLLTRKPLLVILNVGDGEVGDRRIADELAGRTAAQRLHVVQVSAKIEEELAALDPAERPAFLKELGIREPAIDGLTRVSYEALGLISYFTVGVDEVRAWTVRRGAAAPEAGRAIHSDIERGFIRAELMKYNDLMSLGTEQAVASAGKAYLKGKEYVVEDGDILNFRFSV